MIKIKFFIVFILLTQISQTICGQSALQVIEIEGERRSVPLRGKAEVLFISKSKNLVIESSRPSLDTHLDPQKNASGEWEYTIQLQLVTRDGSTNERTFTITEFGTTDRVVVPKKIYVENNRYVFKVNRNKNTIFLVPNTQPNDAYLVTGKAAVEILSTMAGEVQPHPKLPCSIKKRTTEAGVQSTEIIIDMVQYGKLKNNFTKNREKYEQYNASLISRAEEGRVVSDGEWDSLDRWQEQIELEESELAEISIISLSQKESNTLTIDVAGITPMCKWVYEVKNTENVQGGKLYSRHRWLALANYAFSPQPQHSFGITVARVGQFGWYANILTNGSFQLTADHEQEEATHGSYLWSGERRTSRFSISVGGVVALWNFGYFYTGVGYGIRNLIWYTQNGETVSINNGHYSGLLIDAGLIVNANDYLLCSVGFDIQVPKTYYEFKIGVGIRF